MTSPTFIQIHGLHSYPGTLLNRDDAGLAKRLPFGGIERLRVSSQCLKRHWRKADDVHALRHIDPAISVSVRSRRSWQVEIFQPLLEAGLPEPALTKTLDAMQEELYGKSDKAKDKKKKEGAEAFARDELVVLGRPEIDYLKSEAETVALVAGEDEKAIKDRLKDLRKNFHALRAGAGIDAAMFGRFVSGDREARIDAAVHVAHAFSVHEQASEPDYFTAVDDLPSEGQAAGSAHLNTADLTSGLYYGYVVVDLPLLISNLEGCERDQWRDAEHDLAAKTLHHLLHLVAKVTPGAKKGSTAPYDWASLLLIEAGEEQPRTLANAFLDPVKRAPFEVNAAKALDDHVRAIDGMYGNSAKRWLASRIDGATIADAEKGPLPMIADALATFVKAA